MRGRRMSILDITASPPVMIIGAGPVGLALALDLAQRGWPSIVIERETGRQLRAKAGTLSIRTMEHCRRWGLIARIASAGFPDDYPGDIVYCTSLNGYLVGRETLPSTRERRPPASSPEILRRCPQLWFDPILEEAACATGLVDLRRGVTFDDFEQDDEGITARITDTANATSFSLRGSHLVGCDGVASTLRCLLGASFEGVPALSYSINVLIRMPDFLSCHDKGKAERYLLLDETGVWGNVTCIDGRDLWRFTLVGSEEQPMPERGAVEAAWQRAMGRDDLTYEILSIKLWRRSACVASVYRSGRVLLAGDSAHAMSSTGGHGMNTGIGDAVDLGWKLDAVKSGWAGTDLLDSYVAERRAVAQRNVAAATGNFAIWKSAGKDWARLRDAAPAGEAARRRIGEALSESLQQEWISTGVSLGYRYEGSPIIVPDGTPEPPDPPSDYVPTARPGHRAPHAFMADGRSVLDLFGEGFVLLRFDIQALGADSLAAAAAVRGVPFRIEDISDTALAALYERSLILVRPDGHVAWRGDEVSVQMAEAIIGRVCGALPGTLAAQGAAVDADHGVCSFQFRSDGDAPVNGAIDPHPGTSRTVT